MEAFAGGGVLMMVACWQWTAGAHSAGISQLGPSRLICSLAWLGLAGIETNRGSGFSRE